METLFDFFETLDEMVYVSDVDTHDLVYMNRHLRESLGYPAHETYTGKKCYEVLQMKGSPCSFCNNDQIKTDQFITWIHENPALKKRFIVKDRMIVSDGHRYRVEVALRMDKAEKGNISIFYNRSETILNECLQYFFISQNPSESIDVLLSYLGQTFHCDRVYIFEIDSDETTSNTYEWCGTGISPQKDILQKLPLSDISYWMEAFEKGEIVLIWDLKEIRTTYPATYSLLQPQGINSLIAMPIYSDDQLKGFIGVDNPDQEMFALLEQVLKALSGAVAVQFKRCELYHHFNEMSYRDSLTGAYNRNALDEHYVQFDACRSFGVVYCDINGLKETNDIRGHNAGNRLLQNCYHILEYALNTEWIYRVGGDEFVALYCDVDQDKLKEDLDALNQAVMQSDCQMSIGYAWTDQQPIDKEQVIHQADVMMYDEKAAYYENLKKTLDGGKQGKGLERTLITSGEVITDSQLKLQKFLSNTYCDVSFLLALIGNDSSTSCFFFGDMQKNIFYVSDSMRDKFGFESNVVPDLVNKWALRIHDENLLKRFRKDMDDLLSRKQESHDLRYPITDAQGNNIWIRCFGKIEWSEDGTKPLFFAGQITHQDEGFVVDSLTNFPRETVLMQSLEYIKKHNQHCQVIGFSFNNIAQINNNHGRGFGDDLIREMTEQMYEKLSAKATFYRMSGMRCLALMDVISTEETEKFITQVKKVISDCYRHMGVLVQNPCSFAVLRYPQGDTSPQDFIEAMVSLIRVARNSPDQLYIDNSKGDIQEIQNQSNMEMKLSQDIMDGMKNFRIVVQPLVSTENRQPVGGETLLRWQFEGKDVPPSIFIPIIERENMIHLVGRWVFEQAVHTCSRIRSYCPDWYLSVNASLQQLNDEGFIDFIRETLEKYSLDGKHIVVEMTESCMDEQPEKLVGFVEACANMGIQIALDDFGSGYSSLRVLLQYPSSIIKLDRSLLLEMTDSFDKNNFITSIVYACHQFGKKVCMEGVETEFQEELVREAGCDMIQGFYFYRPMETDQIYTLMDEKFAGEEEQGM